MTALRHIMMTADAVGGVWVYATTLARRLAALGTRVTLVTLGPPPRQDKYEAARALPFEVELIVTDLELEWLDPEGRDAERARHQLRRIADRARPDLVHLNGFREGAIGWPCPSLVVAHSCVTSWWQATKRERPPEPRWHAYAEAVAEGLNAADAWAAPTRAFRATIEQLYQPETSGWVIPNGIDLPPPSDADKDAVILASGRVWDSAKNLTALANIARDLPWPVHIAGAGEVEIAECANVHWLGEISRAELLRRMQRAGIYAAPALYEPFGLGILEAAAAGCALVLSDIASLRELWDGAAVHVPADDPERLGQALRELCGDVRRRGRLQRAAAARARRYSLDRTVAGYLKLYESVLAPRASRAPRPTIGSEVRA